MNKSLENKIYKNGIAEQICLSVLKPVLKRQL